MPGVHAPAKRESVAVEILDNKVILGEQYSTYLMITCEHDDSSRSIALVVALRGHAFGLVSVYKALLRI